MSATEAAPPTLTLGTRGSDLALRQTEMVKEALAQSCPDLAVRVEVVATTGDRRPDLDLARPGDSGVVDKGIFTRELEERLLDGSIDAAVHSSKDVPTEMDDRLRLGAFLPREDVRDVLVSSEPVRNTLHLAGLDWKIGTSSFRRARLLGRMAPACRAVPIRGNVPTRIRRLEDAGEYDAIILAAAGLLRLGYLRPDEPFLRLDGRVYPVLWLDPRRFLPAAGQGAVTVQVRTGDAVAGSRIGAIDDAATRCRVESERHFLAQLGAGCQTPIGVHTEIRGDQFHFLACVFSEEDPGRSPAEVVLQGPLRDPLELARVAGLQIPREES